MRRRARGAGPPPPRWPRPTPEVLAREKLARVFGAAHADRHLTRLLGEMGIDALTTMEELDRFAQWLKGRGGIEAAVGAAISTQRLMQRIQQQALGA